MAECNLSEANKNVSDSFKQSSDVQSCQDVKIEKVMEPLLLEDIWKNNVPQSLKNLLDSFERQGIVPSKSEFLVGCIYLFMLEYGFVPQEKGHCYSDCGFNYKCVKELASFPGWKKVKENSYSMSFVLAPHYLFVCRILCIKKGDDLIINAIVKNIENVDHTIMLDILSYFTDAAYAKADLSKVQNLKRLSCLFKSQIAFPVKHAVLRLNELRHPCFEDLPLEIIFYIFKFFRGTDIARLTATSKHFYSIRQDAKLWENIILQDYNYSATLHQSYVELMKEYGRLYKLEFRGKRDDSRKRMLIIV